MSADFIVRLIGMVVFAIIGVSWGISLGQSGERDSGPDDLLGRMVCLYHRIGGCSGGTGADPFYYHPADAGAAQGFRAHFGADADFCPDRPGRRPDHRRFAGVPTLAAAASPGFVSALSLASFSLDTWARLFLSMRQNDLTGLFSSLFSRTPLGTVGEPTSALADSRTILLDTSVIIDGRIADIARTGFLPGSLLIPAVCPGRTAIYCRFIRQPAPPARAARHGSAVPAAEGSQRGGADQRYRCGRRARGG